MQTQQQQDAPSTTRKRYQVFEVGFSKGWADTKEEATRLARYCFEAAYIVDRETGETINLGGPVSG